jgi:hypothetical protein
MRYFRNLVTCWAILLLVACSGGGDSSSSSPARNSSQPVDGFVSTTIAPNGITFVVGSTASGGVNISNVSVTICQPGTTICQTINNILLDTGSTGLRILSSALSSATNPLQLNTQTYNGSPVLECASFRSGSTWGPIKLADVKMASELASAIPIQVIGDPKYLTSPSAFTCGGPALQDASSLSANGIIGIGLLITDGQGYFTCGATGTSNTCSSIPLPASSQVKNPVAVFTANNNGIVMQLPSVPDTGGNSVVGNLYFGIDTQANNSSVGASIIPASGVTFTSTFNGNRYPSFFDSGSNGYFFPVNLPACSSGWYCPSTTQSYFTTAPLNNGTNASLSFSIANAQSLFGTQNGAFSNLGGPVTGFFDYGIPFFFGRTMYFGIAGKASANAGTGPYYGYKSN